MDEKIYVTRSSMPPYKEYIEMIKPLWDSHWLTNMGYYHNEFENQLKQYLQVKEISLMTNGHMALELAIQAMHLEGEVITTPFTFASTAHAIVRNKLKPIFADISPETYTINPDHIVSLISNQTSAIIPVHVYGQVCNVEAIEKIAKEYHLKVIYDAAHTFGCTYCGRALSSFGDASILSFHATKVFNSIEGGAVVYHQKDYGRELYRLKNFGIRSQELVDGVGANAKMDEFRAIMGICNLKYIDYEISKRKLAYERYTQNLQNIPGIKLLPIQKNVVSNYAYFPIQFNKSILKYGRDEVYNWLLKENICARKYFYPLITKMKCYKDIYSTSETPVAETVSKNILVLPLFSDILPETIDKICSIVRGEFHG